MAETLQAGSTLDRIARAPKDSDTVELDPTGRFKIDKTLALKEPVTLDDATRAHNMLEPSQLPGFVDLTHPEYFDEACLPHFSKVYLQANGVGPIEAARASTTGRVIDIDVLESKPALGGSDDKIRRYTILDDASMPGELGMRKKANAAREAGVYSPYEQLLDSPEDIFFVWRYNRSATRANGQKGDWGLESIIAPDAHPEDSFGMWAEPVVDKDREAAFDSNTYRGTFLDSQSYDDSLMENTPLGGLKDKQAYRAVRILAGAIAGRTLTPDYSPEEDDALNEDAWSDKLKRLASLGMAGDKIGLRDIYDEVMTNLTAFAGHPVTQPARMYARAARIFDHLDEYEALYGESDELDTARQLTTQSVLAGATYTHELSSRFGYLDAATQFKKQKAGDHQTPTQPGIRFTMFGLDHYDMDIAEAASKVKSKFKDQGNKSQVAIADGLENILVNGRGRANTLAVRAVGNNYFNRFTNLKPDDSEAQQTQMILYDGTGLAYGAQGHYWDEVIDSTYSPESNNGRFPDKPFGPPQMGLKMGGLAMSGVVTAFELVTPEQQHDGTTTERFMITSAKEQPNIITQTILDEFYGEDRDTLGLRSLTNGSMTLSHIATQDRPQRWHLATTMMDADGRDIPKLEIANDTLENGRAFAFAYDAQGNSYPDFGHIKGHKPRKREWGQQRPSKKPGINKKDIEWNTRQTGNLTVKYQDGGRTVSRVEEDNFLFEIACASGALYVRDTPDARVTSRITEHFRVNNPNFGRKWRRDR